MTKPNLVKTKTIKRKTKKKQTVVNFPQTHSGIKCMESRIHKFTSYEEYPPRTCSSNKITNYEK